MHSQAHEITNNLLKTMHYEIGINLPHIIYEFQKDRSVKQREELGLRHGVRAANTLHPELGYTPLNTRKIAISHLIYLDFARVRQVWKSRPDNGSGHIHCLHTNAQHGGRWSV